MVHVRHVSTYRLIVFALVSLVLILGGLFYAIYAGWQSDTSQSPVVTGPTTVTGKIVCLPHKDQNGPQTLECAYGLQAADGTYYGLQGLSQEDLITGRLTAGAKVTVHGTMQAVDNGEKYAVVGNIKVESVDE
jgi:hypothetical protein